MTDSAINFHIDIQHVSDDSIPVTDEVIIHWVNSALESLRNQYELTIRLVNEFEMIELNHQYRNKNKVTNVLSFPSSHPAHVELDFPFLGDIIICPSVLKEESIISNIDIQAHWAHIVIHGVLHLLGYDHIIEQDAKIMQDLEIKILKKLNFSNPYHHQSEEPNLD